MKKYKFIVMLFILILWFPAFSQETDSEDSDTETLTADSDAAKIIVNKYRLGDGITFCAPDGGYNINLRGFLQTTFETRKYEGDDQFYSRFRMRRLRLRLSGDAWGDKVSYRLQTDFAQANGGDGELSGMLLDAFIAYKPVKGLTLSFGQKSTPTDNRELGITSNTLQLVDRSKLSSYFGSIREVGLFVDGSFRIGHTAYLRPSIVITDGDGSATFTRRHGGLKYGARINYLPFGLFRAYGENRGGDMAREVTPKLSVGTTFSYNVGISDRRGRESGSILYLNDENKETLPDYIKFGADFHFKYMGFSVLGEFVKTWAHVPSEITQRVRNDGTTSTDFSGNMKDYVKARMMLGTGYNIQAGYMFQNRLSIDARYTHFDPDKNSFLHNELYFNRNNFYEVGVSKYLTKSYAVKVQASVVFVDAEPGSKNVNSIVTEGNETLLQAMIQFSF